MSTTLATNTTIRLTGGVTIRADIDVATVKEYLAMLDGGFLEVRSEDSTYFVNPQHIIYVEGTP